MSWVSSLCALYDTNAWRAGEIEMWNRGGKLYSLMLLPLSHTTVRARIEITLDQDGNLLEARMLGKDEPSETIAPATEEAVSRTSTTVAPYPLFDSLKYVAGDFLDHVKIELDTQKKIDDARKHIADCFPKYIDFLNRWCTSDFAHPKVCAVYQYLSRKTVAGDLIEHGVLLLDKTGFASSRQKINGEELPKATVRFRVRMNNEVTPSDILCDLHNSFDSAMWLDKTVQQSFIDFYASLPAAEDLCYMSGEITRTSALHPKKIRYDGDGTKLISANDDSNFSYRGRFNTKDKKTGYNEALSIGYKISQKAHNALKWIIRRQGFTRDGVCVITWESALNDMPGFYESAASIMAALPEDTDEAELIEDMLFNDEEAAQPDTNYASAEDFNAALDGYASKLSDTSKMMVITLDSATPGRLAMIYYKELDSSRYLDNIRLWHESCCWRHEYIKDKKLHGYEGMASIRDVATAVYGTEQGKEKSSKRIELRKNSDGKCPMLISAFDRLRPCIIDGAAIPRDMVRAAVMKASNPLAYEVKFNYNKVLHIACSLVKRLYWEKKKRNESEGVILEMELDRSKNDRSYLYGRLLAIAEDIERRTYERDETRVTNAERYMQAFVQNPFRTWPMIQRSIKPYLNSLKPGSRKFYKDLFGEITGLFADGDFEAKNALNGKYLIGYDCQRTVLQAYQPKGKSNPEENKTDDIEEEE
ncbi:MAG: CRISPR-associated protein (Cas_Csd1) [Pelotomaculum sp. PtaB.Bin013]|uniref:Type I-C CRISPR-associated protein Cas8c/Csd1 n=1 Tax=Pelotomaculum isophthalicicum JI TaxID=947010 RepID=A0A9X4H0G3_9FIRM|nr:type I-C CRISPR-associated protein Cas8c/Csd1 [Pelotomaculum isophthalicicum]MDF9407200.1 type I-C CRISPR-associated protein Cas8c/Csd1 [Pelotomaculum isophthalicicum JI]OPX90844.1 MAG: CRISPR-associated protein (Cas_Csd1) [Pelotomaculum sp. PtaB.Bin013]